MTAYSPGDIVLVRNYSGHGDLIGNLILAGQRARYGNADAARWTHSALIISPAGDLVEALSGGVSRTNIAKYAHVETLIVHVHANDDERIRIVAGAITQLGDAYGVLDFVSLAFSLLTGLRWSLHADRQPICSELCARFTEKIIPAYPYVAERMMPADLGFFWGALTGEPLPPLSVFGRFLDRVRLVAWALSPFTKGIKP